MPNGIAYTNIGVFADHLLPNFLERVKNKKVETDFTFNDYPLVDWFMRQFAMKFRGGQSLQFRIQRGTSGDAIKIRPYQPIPRNYADRITKGTANWHALAKAAAWNQRVSDHFTDDTALIEYVDSQYLDCMKGVIDAVEKAIVSQPESSADDMPMNGLPYLFPMLGSGVINPQGTFGGSTAILGDASTTTTIQGVDRSVVTAARTWAATKNGVNTAYLDTLRRAMNRTNFKPPSGVKGYTDTTARELIFITNQTEAEQYEQLVNLGPDNRNGDANPFYGMLTYRGMAWRPCPALDGKSYNPAFGVNVKKTFPFGHSKYWWKWSEPFREPGDDESWYKRCDIEFQMACINERSGGFCLHDPR